jgi:hypothetical protein
MNYQNFNQSGGFPFQTETLDEMQKATTLFNKFGYLAGNFAIISGCIVTGALVSDGAVFIDGELLEFRGGQLGTDVLIVEEITAQEFEDGNDKNVLFVRYATFGIGATSFPWGNFKRPKTTVQLSEDKAEQSLIETLIDRIEILEARPYANVPIGMIAIWDRPFNEIPDGWIEHQPLRGKMPIGLDLTDPEFDALGVTGGIKEKPITRDFLPNFRFSINLPANNFGTPGTGGIPFSGANNNTVTLQTEPMGNAQPFNIMNPYRVVHFIKYVG